MTNKMESQLFKTKSLDKISSNIKSLNNVELQQLKLCEHNS